MGEETPPPPPEPRLGPGGLPRPQLWQRGQAVRMLGLFLVAVVATVISFAVVSRIGHPLLAGGTPAPAITLQDASGKAHAVFTESTGTPVVLEFFETTCEVCQHEVRPMCDVQAKHRDVPFYGVDAAREKGPAVESFRRSQGGGCMAWPLLLDPKSSVLRAYNVTVVPTVYLIDARGRVAYTGTGEAGVAGLDQAIALVRKGG